MYRPLKAGSMSAITSRQHPIVKQFRELAHGTGPSMLLDGWHLLTEAVAAGIAIETVAWCGPLTIRPHAMDLRYPIVRATPNAVIVLVALTSGLGYGLAGSDRRQDSQGQPGRMAKDTVPEAHLQAPNRVKAAQMLGLAFEPPASISDSCASRSEADLELPAR